MSGAFKLKIDFRFLKVKLINNQLKLSSAQFSPSYFEHFERCALQIAFVILHPYFLRSLQPLTRTRPAFPSWSA